MNVTAYIGFGTNQGDLYKNFMSAKNKLAHHPHIQLNRVSELYSTEPLTKNNEKQSWYLNCVFEISTTLTLHKLLEELKKIEKQMGRKSQKRWAARIADLDILFYGNVIYADDEIQIPHQEMIHRKFVLKPLCDLIPDFLHPDLKLPLNEILEWTRDSLQIKPVAKPQHIDII